MAAHLLIYPIFIDKLIALGYNTGMDWGLFPFHSS
jgi:hypothetical protein